MNRAISIVFLLFCLGVFSVALHGQTYTTIDNGDWTDTDTWQSGSVPPTSSTIPASATINIRHTVAYNTGNPIKNDGVIRIQPIAGTIARLNVPTGINIENFTTGDFYIIGGSLVQCRFVNCNDGQPYSGTAPSGGGLNAGTFKNIGGFVEARNSYVEIAQDWTNESNGTRLLINTCVKTGQNFSMSGSDSIDNFLGVNLTIGWHGSGNYQSSDGTLTAQHLRVQIAGTSGSFQLNSGTANGDIDYVFLRNHVAGFSGSGGISASSSVSTSGLNLDARCSATYTPNGKFSGPQTSTCALTYFPGDCPAGGAAPAVSVNLALNKMVNDGSCVVAGQTRVFTLTATNPDDNFIGSSVIVNDPLPTGLTFLSSSGDGSYNSGTGVWTVGHILAGQTRTRTITVEIPPAPGIYTNTASYGTLEQNDPNTTDNSSSVTLAACVSAASVSVSGRVLTAEGLGIRNAELEIIGGHLSEPLRALTGPFGSFTIEGLELGSTYLITVRSKNYSFPVTSHVITPVEDVSDLNFIASPVGAMPSVRSGKSPGAH